MKLICNKCKNDCKKSGKQLNGVQKYRCKTCGLYQQKNYVYNAYKHEVREQFSRMNRLSESRSYENGLSSNTWNPAGYGNAYYNAFTYDAMGNILTQQRHKRDGTQIEDLTYHYHYNSNGELVRNRLYHVNDAIASSVDSTDIDDMGTFVSAVNQLNTDNNYAYDAEGRLVKDVQEEIDTIIWRVDGKVKEIRRSLTSNKKNIIFDYDAMGHRIAKHVYNNQTLMLEKSTYYILDAQGIQMSVYEHTVDTSGVNYYLSERNIYGSSRLGATRDTVNMYTPQLLPSYGLLSNRNYELSNHLGNVLVLINDYIIPLDNDANEEVDGYQVGIVSIADYSPFGVTLDGRTFNSSESRYGFNGMEKDDELKSSEGTSYDFGNRMYDPRVGRFLSIDKFEEKFPNMSPYSFSANSPIWLLDSDGDSVWVYSETIDKTLGVGRHMFMRVKTADRDVIIELYGPHNEVGQPQVNDYTPNAMNRSEVIFHQVWEPINKNDPDKFENDLIKYAEYIKSKNVTDKEGNVTANPLLPKYDAINTNSNGYVRALIEYAGGSLEYKVIYGDLNIFEDSPLPSIEYLPGASWENLEPYFKILRNQFTRDEYYNNTYGMTLEMYNQCVKLANDINNSAPKDNSYIQADNTKVNNTPKMQKPKEKKKMKSANNNL